MKKNPNTRTRFAWILGAEKSLLALCHIYTANLKIFFVEGEIIDLNVFPSVDKIFSIVYLNSYFDGLYNHYDSVANQLLIIMVESILVTSSSRRHRCITKREKQLL